MIAKRITALVAAAALAAAPAALAQGKPARPGASKPAPVGSVWNATVNVTPQGTRVLGNPAAALKLTEYVSYTCPHCAHFEEASAGQLKLVFIAGGKGSIEVRHVVRDPIDMTIALLTNCLPPRRFFEAHEAFMRYQDTWEALVQKLTAGQQKRWDSGDNAARLRAIAADLQFFPLVERFGLSRPAAERCLADKALMDRLAAGTKAATEAGVTGTPSFAVNGTLLMGTHDWATLGPQLAARM